MSQDDTMEGMAPSGTAAPGDPLNLDLQLCFALYTASNRVTRLYRPFLQPLGLTYPQYLAMMALWERAPQSMGELTERLRLDSGTLAPLFDRLEGRGLVARARDPQDERRVLVSLTEAGQALRAQAVEIPREVFCRLPLPLEDLVRLKQDLDRLLGGLD